MKMKMKHVEVGHLIRHEEEVARVISLHQHGDLVCASLQDHDGRHCTDLVCLADELVDVHVAEGN